jgi:uncharacterized protein YvpB
MVLGNRYSGKSKSSEIKNSANNIVSDQASNDKNVETPQQETLPENKILPEKILLKVPFMSQAPFQKWDALHEDSCEEASLIMLADFIQKKEAGNTSQQEKEIQNLVAFEKKNGYKPSVTLEELNQIAEKYYKLDSGRTEKNVTIDDIKKELGLGHPIIVGAAGKVLPNPNFKNGGPNYHMLVIVGYDQNDFITNDPGTRKGESFRYTFDGLFNAIHDWNAKNILNGGKNYLVFD